MTKELHYKMEISLGDIKLYITHIIAMGLVRKSNMEKYWSQD